MGNETLGNVLERIRTEAHMSVDRASRLSRIRPDFIEAMERDDFASLPSDLYARKFLLAYAEVLELDQRKVLDRYEREQRAPKVDEISLKPEPAPAKRQIVLTRVFYGASVLMLFLGVVGYLGWQLKGLVEPPPLVVETPNDNLIVDQSSVVVAGQTQEESTVMINGQPVSVDTSGRFEELVGLKEGVNTITISARTKHSSETTVHRRILVEREALSRSR